MDPKLSYALRNVQVSLGEEEKKMILKKGNIQVARWDMENKVSYPGLIGKHLGLLQMKEEGIDWSIVHLKTGYSVVPGFDFSSFRQARDLMETLDNHDKINWDFDSPLDMPNETKLFAREIIQKATGREFA